MQMVAKMVRKKYSSPHVMVYGELPTWENRTLITSITQEMCDKIYLLLNLSINQWAK